MLAQDFLKRRVNLFNSLKNNSASVLIFGRKQFKRTSNILYPFNQFSDIVYLTGYTRPEGALTIHQENGKIISTLYLPQNKHNDHFSETPHTTFDEAQKLSGVDKILPMNEIDSWLSRRINDPKNIYFSSPSTNKEKAALFNSISPFINSLRIIKEPKEISLIKKACEISKISHDISLSLAKPGISESLVAARFKLECFERGATGLAYPIVAASGKNACRLHYIDNNKIMHNGECLMLDAGCEYQNYASDFTRTVPVGKISTAHRDLLEMIEETKFSLCYKVKKGQIYSLGHLHHSSEDMIMRGLKQLGINIRRQNLQIYYPHGVSHWIGLDVHDCDTILYDFPLKKGCVFSVEPGIYFPDGAPDVPKEFQGMGCRFEDTVIIE